jgi:signal transduction histidine kinase
MAVFARARGSERTFGGRIGPGAIAMFIFLGTCGVVTLVGGKELADAAGALGVFVGFGVTGTLFLRRATLLTGRERLGWSLIGSGMIVAALGVLVVGTVYLMAGDAPTFGWPDLFFFATYATIIVGFSVLPHTQGSRLHRTRMLLDGLIGAVSIGALLWVYVLSDVMLDLADAPTVTRVVGGIYPFLDLLALTVAMLVLLRRSAFRFDARIALFTVGILAQVVGDVIFLAAGHSGSFEDAEPLYIVNLLAIAAFFGSALMLDGRVESREYADRNPPLWTVVAPYLPAVGMLAMFVLETYIVGDGQAESVLLAATILVGLLVIARQGVAIVENRADIEQQRDALVSTISHELRTPLTSVVGFASLLEEGLGSMDSGERLRMVTIIRQQADHMSRIVADLIMLARGVGNDLRLAVEGLSMVDLVERSIDSSGIPRESVEVECSPNLTAFVDAGRIQQVLSNLLTNAERYGGRLRLVRVVAEGSDLVIEVHDDGEGIPRRYELRVWDRFERGPNRFNASVPGSGIGLSIVLAIAAAHGGTAKYRRSERLGGACFEVRLPGRAAIKAAATQVPERLREASSIRPVA